MDAITIFGTLITAATLTGTAFAATSWRIVGKIEGLTIRYGKRLDDHSEEIKKIDAIVASWPSHAERLERLITDLRTSFESVSVTNAQDHAIMRQRVDHLTEIVEQLQEQANGTDRRNT